MNVRLASAGLAVLVAGAAMAPTLRSQQSVPDGASVMVSTLAGSSPLTPLKYSYGLGYAANDDLYMYASDHFVLLKLTPDGVLSTVAGTGGCCNTDGGPGVGTLSLGYGLAVAPDGTSYLAQGLDHNIRKITPAGVITSWVGTFRSAGHADGVGTAATFTGPRTMALGPGGTLFVVDGYAIRRVASDATVTTLAGSATVSGVVDGNGTAARFLAPAGLAVDESSNVYVSDGQAIRRITPAGDVTTLAGVPGNVGTADGIAARFTTLISMTYRAGTMFVQDMVGPSPSGSGCSIRQVTTAGVVTTHPRGIDLCGQSLSVNSENGLAIMKRFVGFQGATPVSVVSPAGVETMLLSATGSATAGTGADVRFGEGLMSIVDRGHGQLLVGSGALSQYRMRVNSRGVVSALTTPNLMPPRALAVDTTGKIYSAQGCGIQAFVMNPATPNGITITDPQVGNYDPQNVICGNSDGTGYQAYFQAPQGVTVSTAGVAFVADTGSHTIRRVSADNVVTTFAGGAAAPGTTDATGTSARFNGPRGIVITSAGTLYVADTGNHTIRAITATGEVTTLAGLAGTSGGANGTGAAARFNHPYGLALDRDGSLLVADTDNHAIRRVTTAGVVTTVAGAAGVAGLTEGDGTVARFYWPWSLTVDASGTIFVLDAGNRKVRQVLQSAAAAPAITTSPSPTTANGGGDATFTCAASGTPTPSYSWQQSTNGTTWTDLTNSASILAADSPQMTLKSVASSMNGRQYRCVAGSVAGSATSAAAQLTVTNFSLAASPTTLQFGAVKAGSAGAITTVTPAQTVSLTYTAPSAPVWTVTADQPWIQITGGSGTGAGSFTVGIVNPSNVIGSSTSLTGTVTVTASNVGLVRTIPVVLRITHSAARAAPLGNFDTPVNNAQNLSGAIVVSGWAIDDVAIDKVEIWRDLVAGETTPPYVGPGPGNGKVFVALGLFGPGTRPDVETLYHTLYPKSDRTGWGYMLLTYGFPDRGNGTYKLYAFAYDTEGQTTTLGSKTISVNNNAATKPFGTLDYPEQNGAVSGVYTAVGWVLTPNVNGVPTCIFDHIVMELDSNEVYIPVTYGLSRPDVTAAFPGLSTSSAPGASAAFDSTTFTNGIHTIGWLAYDTCGRGEGIGSRFITITNSSGGDTAVRPTRDLRSAGLDAPELPRQTVRVDVMELAELTLPTIDGATWTGREVVAGEARQLPVGSSLDPVTGRFAWRPMAGFFGTFDLRFVATVNGVAVAQVPVRVIVGPGVRLAIDMPSSHEQVPGVFTIAGWVADLGASEGTGIDAVHVWAYPLEGGGDPIFAGHAGLGAPRPDVAEVHGAQFEASGYYLTVGHLPRGWYDIVVYPHSSVDGEFRGARVVRVYIK